jgi:arginase
MHVSLIQVPYMLGDERHGASRGPERLLQGGADRILAAAGVSGPVVRIDRGAPFRDSVSASLAVNRQVAAVISQAVDDGRFPLVLAGSCEVSIGVLAGFDHARCGVVWFDAHGDFNTPESTITGFFGGMPLAVITGHCYRNLWAQVGDSAPVAEAATLLIGVRDLDPAERERLQRSAVRTVPWLGGRPLADIEAAVDELATRVPEVYLHVDVDALDPEAVPGIGDYRSPGGLSLADMESAIRATAARLRIRAATLATFNPEDDADGSALRACLRIIEVLAACVRGQ